MKAWFVTDPESWSFSTEPGRSKEALEEDGITTDVRQTNLPLALLSGAMMTLSILHISFQTMMMMKLLMKVTLTMMPARQLSWEWGRLLPWKNWVKRIREERSLSPSKILWRIPEGPACRLPTLWRLQKWTSCGHHTHDSLSLRYQLMYTAVPCLLNLYIHVPIMMSHNYRRKWPILRP